MTLILSSVVFLLPSCLGLSTVGHSIGRVRELSSSIQTARVQLAQSTYLRDRSGSLVWVVADMFITIRGPRQLSKREHCNYWAWATTDRVGYPMPCHNPSLRTLPEC